MPAHKRTPRAVEIVLTEEDLEAIIAETARVPRPVPAVGDPWGDPGPDPGPEEEGAAGTGRSPGSRAQGGVPGEQGFTSISDRVWRRGVPCPGAVGDAIRRILDATNLDPGREEE